MAAFLVLRPAQQIPGMIVARTLGYRFGKPLICISKIIEQDIVGGYRFETLALQADGT